MLDYGEEAHGDDQMVMGDELEAFEAALREEELGIEVEAPIAEAPAAAR